MTEKIRLIVACEYTLYREAISRVLLPEGDIEIVAEASRVIEVKRAVRQTRANLLLLDMDMTELNAPEVLSLVREKNPDLGVLLFIMRNDDEKRIVEAICAGALGYILKSTNAAELTKSIRVLVQGEVWIPRKMMAKVISTFSSFIRHLPLQSEGL
jgi:two-component system, NarL family, response regulator DegU